MRNIFLLRYYFAVASLIIAAISFGCGDGKREDNSGMQFRAAKGGKFYGGTYRVNEVGDLRSLDPVGINDVTSHHIAHQVYDLLVDFDENLHLKPELAESWEISPDGLTYTYHLRKGVKFHDNLCFRGGKGREFTAGDVKYSFTRVCDARTGTLGYDYFRGKVEGADAYYAATQAAANGGAPAVKEVTGFIVKDEYTFQIRLTKPFAPFENYAALGIAYIHPREAVEKYGRDFFQHPVGTGAFKFISWSPDRECILERNVNYWKTDADGNQFPYLDKIHFSFIKDEKSQIFEFRGGNLEECYRIPNEFFTSVVGEDKKLKGEYSKFQLLHLPAMSTQYYGMLTSSKEFSDVRVRRAFSMAVDRERIVKYVLKGQAYAAGTHGLVPPSMPDYQTENIKGYEFNPTTARALLAEAGYPNGVGLPPITLQLNNGGGRNLQIAEAAQAMIFENLGVKVSLTQVEFAKHLDEVDAGRAPFFRLGWVADYPDPENFLNLLYGALVPEDGKPSPINHTRYRNAEFDKIFAQALSTNDRAARMKLYMQAEQIAMNDAPMIIVFYDEDYRLLAPYVEGYRNNAMDRRTYEYVWINPVKL
ncbi:MAG: ABC transporter substrate-binding protein [Bacteroidetes bacterium]|jgi:peptide/nickel transport system substrate-binding protein|nr:ABC transporter substrate-binding protein [Bacteroidota bacterium]MCZ2133167.1 ABC transporter substrate-binding protein [Bacteroidota bacterium]